MCQISLMYLWVYRFVELKSNTILWLCVTGDSFCLFLVEVE